MAAESTIEIKHRAEEKSPDDFYSRIALIVAGGRLPRRAPSTSSLGKQMTQLCYDFNSTFLKDATGLLNMLHALPILPRTDGGIIGIKNTGLGKNKFEGTLLITLLYKNNNETFELKVTHHLLMATFNKREEDVTLPNAGQDIALIITDRARKETTFSITDINHALLSRALEHAINDGDFDLVTKLAPDVDLNSPLSDGEFALYKAYKTNTGMIKTLLSNGAKEGADDIWRDIHDVEASSGGVAYPLVQAMLNSYSLCPPEGISASYEAVAKGQVVCLIKHSEWHSGNSGKASCSNKAEEDSTEQFHSRTSSPVSE